MKIEIPYNAGEFRRSSTGDVMICGHIWWPVEKVNAYHVLRVDAYGEPQGNPVYEWDHSHGKWAMFEPKQKAA
jgi:hypothetical protein